MRSIDDRRGEGDSQKVWRRYLGYLGGFFLGAVLLVGGVSKSVDPLALMEQIRIDGLDFLLSEQAVAYLALGLEFGLGAALVFGLRRLWILVPASLLVALFLFLTGRTYWNYAHGIVDESVSCGCFGNLVERTPGEAFWQDLLLMVPALAIAFIGRPGTRRVGVPMTLTGVVTAAGLALAWKAPDLPLDDLATRLKPGKLASGLCAGEAENRICLNGIIPELEDGEHIVVIGDLSSQTFGEAVPELNRYYLGSSGPTLWVLSSANPEEHHQFFWKWAPSFQVQDAPPALLRSFYRSLPRSFLVSEGRVTHTFSGLPPFEALANGPEESEDR